MLDYTNLFECDCGKLIPLGAEKCPYCGCDYINYEKWEKEQRKKHILAWFGLVWFFIAPCFIQLQGVEILSSIIVATSIPLILYIWYLNKKIKKYEKDLYKVEMGEYYINQILNKKDKTE